MIDLALVRGALDAPLEQMEKRMGRAAALEVLADLKEKDRRVRELIGREDALRAERNRWTEQIAAQKRAKEDASEAVAHVRRLKDDLAHISQELKAAEEEREYLWLRIPNLPLPGVPAGGEEGNVVVREWGDEPHFAFAPKPHWEIGEDLEIMDLPAGAKVAGSGFPLLKGMGARLERALVQWMIDLHIEEHGYTEVAPPFLVNKESLKGTGQFPKFVEDGDAYETPQDELYLIPTSEVPVVNVHRDEILSSEKLPLRYVAQSPCFRREAGSAGKDTRGLLRVHQFMKVELVRFVRPSESEIALDEMVGEATKVLKLLGLRHRVLHLAGGDTGFGSAQTFDIEVWAPGVGKWLEISSASNCTDFQARRAQIRYRSEESGKAEFVHTLNASGLALPRLMVALLETYQREDGSVRIPLVLAPYMGTQGTEILKS